MEINKNSWHAKFYKWSYNKLEDSLCDYFWKLVLALILLPLTFVGYLIPFTRKDSDLGIINYFLMTLTTYFLLVMGQEIMEDIWEVHFLLQSILGLILIIVSVGLVLGGIFLINYLEENYTGKSNSDYNKSKKPNLVKERWKAFKGKYCPKIDWK